MQKTSINWCLGPDGAQGWSWNPFAGCSPNKPSHGCANCWAERLAATRLAHLPAYHGLTRMTVKAEKLRDNEDRSATFTTFKAAEWSGEVRFFPEKLAEPLRRKKPSGIAVGLMGDIALLPFDDIDNIFGVMAACQYIGPHAIPGHRFYLLTKRPERLVEYHSTDRRGKWAQWAAYYGGKYDPDGLYDQIAFGPRALTNVWQGASASTQADLDRVAPELLRIPAGVHFISYEPALEALTVPEEQLLGWHIEPRHNPRCDGSCSVGCPEPYQIENPRIDWIIAGGESGPNARPCHVDWLRSIVRQCREDGVAPWIKQLGSRPMAKGIDGYDALLKIRDRAGSDMDEFPEDLRVREMPEVFP